MVFELPEDFDPDGDLVLVAFAPSDPSRTPFRLRVCSHALRRASPVWKKMLFGNWKEAKPADGSEWVVELPADNVYPLKIVLAIIHGAPQRFDQCSVEEIYQVLVLTHKYDMTRIVKPWCHKWLENISGHLDSIPASVQALFIAWELGSEEVFARKLEYVSMNTRIDSQGRLILKAERIIVLDEENFLGPPVALQAIAAVRLEIIQKVISVVHEAIKVRTGKEPHCDLRTPYDLNPFDDQVRKQCDVTVVGRIYLEMIQTRGAPLSEHAEDIEDSVVDLAAWIFGFMAKIEGIHFAAPCAPRSTFYLCRENIFTSISQEIHESIRQVVRGAIEPRYMEYMAKQRLTTYITSRPYRLYSSAERYWEPFNYFTDYFACYGLIDPDF